MFSLLYGWVLFGLGFRRGFGHAVLDQPLRGGLVHVERSPGA
jgi:hypothetical protein